MITGWKLEMKMQIRYTLSILFLIHTKGWTQILFLFLKKQIHIAQIKQKQYFGMTECQSSCE